MNRTIRPRIIFLIVLAASFGRVTAGQQAGELGAQAPQPSSSVTWDDYEQALRIGIATSRSARLRSKDWAKLRTPAQARWGELLDLGIWGTVAERKALAEGLDTVLVIESLVAEEFGGGEIDLGSRGTSGSLKVSSAVGRLHATVWRADGGELRRKNWTLRTELVTVVPGLELPGETELDPIVRARRDALLEIPALAGAARRESWFCAEAGRAEALRILDAQRLWAELEHIDARILPRRELLDAMTREVEAMAEDRKPHADHDACKFCAETFRNTDERGCGCDGARRHAHMTRILYMLTGLSSDKDLSFGSTAKRLEEVAALWETRVSMTRSDGFVRGFPSQRFPRAGEYVLVAVTNEAPSLEWLPQLADEELAGRLFQRLIWLEPKDEIAKLRDFKRGLHVVTYHPGLVSMDAEFQRKVDAKSIAQVLALVAYSGREVPEQPKLPSHLRGLERPKRMRDRDTTGN